MFHDILSSCKTGWEKRKGENKPWHSRFLQQTWQENAEKLSHGYTNGSAPASAICSGKEKKKKFEQVDPQASKAWLCLSLLLHRYTRAGQPGASIQKGLAGPNFAWEGAKTPRPTPCACNYNAKEFLMFPTRDTSIPITGRDWQEKQVVDGQSQP